MRKVLLAVALTGLCSPAIAQTMNVDVLARTCNSCHGVDGVSAGVSMPSIGGLPREYLRKVMKQWKYGQRSGITMPRIVKGFSDDEIDALAAYFAKKEWVPSPQQAAADVLMKGQATVLDICTDCHGAKGNDPDIDAPPLNGQWAKYMDLEVEKYLSSDFKMPHRRMKKAVDEAKPAEAAAAARYFGAQSR
ncbi:MAG: c-type cytochrome [Solirubrobacterales bacterium]